jgi:hypothetical protein
VRETLREKPAAPKTIEREGSVPARATVDGMETTDTFTFRSTEQDGTIREIELTPEQALDLGAGKAIAYTPRDERIVVDDDGTITYREDARPATREAA